MNILFLTLAEFHSINERGIYYDLMRKFHREGHKVFIVSPIERKYKRKTSLKIDDGVSILQVKVLNNQKANFFEKGLSTLIIGQQFYSAINKYFSEINFDLILYSTPPITFTSLVKKLKKKNSAFTYLLLKDIFPQNAVDLGFFKKNSLIYKYFRKKEIQLYQISDKIGCMSPANVDYLLKNNTFLTVEKVEVNPNSIDIKSFPSLENEDRTLIRNEFGIPTDKIVFVYGGNLGKPQGIDFLLKTIEACQDIEKVFFLIVGNGTEFERVKKWCISAAYDNLKLLESLPKSKYDILLSVCDVGLIFLDPRFTIPNFPSRLLGYLELMVPVISATDTVTDIGTIAEAQGFGFRVLSGDTVSMRNKILELTYDSDLIKEMGAKGRKFLEDNYSTENSYRIIVESFQKYKYDKASV